MRGEVVLDETKCIQVVLVEVEDKEYSYSSKFELKSRSINDTFLEMNL